MGSTPQFAARSDKPIRALGAIAFLLAIAHGWLAAMHWTRHVVNPEAFGFALLAVLSTFATAYAIAGRVTDRRPVRDWNKLGLWFLLLSLVILPALVHGLDWLGVHSR